MDLLWMLAAAVFFGLSGGLLRLFIHLQAED